MKSRVKYKLALYTVCISFLCFICSSLIFYIISTGIINENASSISVMQLNSISENIDFLIKNIESDVNFLSNNEWVQNILDNYNKMSNKEIDYSISKADEAINNFIIKEQRRVDYVEILSKNYDSSFKLGTVEFVHNFGYKDFEKILDNKDLKWVSSKKIGLTILGDISQKKDRVIIIKKIKSIISKEDAGVAVIYLKYNLWQEIIEDIDINLDIVFPDKSIIYKYRELCADVNSYNNERIFSHQKGSFTKNIKGNEVLINYVTSEYSSWKIISYTKMDKLLGQIRKIRNIIFLIGLVCFVCSAMFSFLVSYRITMPINKMEQLIARIQKGDINSGKSIEICKSVFDSIIGNKYNIVAIYVTIIVIPIVISVMAMFSITANSIENQSINYYQNVIKQVSKRIDVGLQSYNNILKYIFGGKNLNKALLECVSAEDEYDNKIKDGIELINLDIDKIGSGELSLSIFSKDKSNILYTGYKQRILKDQLYYIDNSKDNSTIWMPTVYDCGTYLINFGKKIVAFKNYKDIYFFDKIGYVVLTLNEQLINNKYKNNARDSNSVIYIIDSEGTIISHPDKSYIRSKVNEDYIKSIKNNCQKYGRLLIKNSKADKLVAYSKLNYAKWIVIGEIPVKKLIADVQKVKYYSVFIVIANITIIATLILIYMSRIAGQIIKLNNAMQKVSSGNTDVKVDVKTGDEIQRLAEGFNSMVSRLKVLMEENYNQGLRRKEAELNALQAQINPHFLYNTLESINWEAMMLTKGPNKVSEMVTALSDLLRLSINRGKEIVTLEDEINHVKNYLIIQKERYIDKFEVEWDVDDNLYKYKTLKLIMQPLVENAIYHGIELKPDKGLIIIRGQLFEECIKLEIIDDGLGMSKDQLEVVRASLESAEDATDKRSIGIKNVHERIQLYFGNEYGIWVHSEEDYGTRVEIYLPLFEGEDSDQNQ